MVSDPNLSEFYSRISRIEKARARGFGFEAPGTLGRSHYFRPSRRRRSFLMPMVMLLLSVFGLKAMIYYNVGSEIYAHRVEALRAGNGVEPLGAWIMQPDPVTQELAQRIGQLSAWAKRG
ncbi:MAG: hypothetical protein QM656_08020 [Paracoccaceae bacterium]